MAKGEGQLPESVRAEIVTQLLSGGKFAVISRECNVNRKTVQDRKSTRMNSSK